MNKETKLRLAILMDEKNSATQILKDLKKAKDFGRTFKAVRIFRNRINKEIRELKFSNEKV